MEAAVNTGRERGKEEDEEDVEEYEEEALLSVNPYRFSQYKADIEIKIRRTFRY